MSERKDKILIINQDPDETSMFVEGALIPFGYDVMTAADGGQAISMALADPPDVIVLSLDLRGLSGNDVLHALNAQSIEAPVIALADEGYELEALQAFRLGAKDYLSRPFRETELIQAIERALNEVRLRRDREMLVTEVQYAANAAEQHLRELKTLMGIGKSVTSLRRLDDVFDLVIRAAIHLTSAESAGLFLRDERANALVLRHGHNLSRNLIDRIGQPIRDDLALLVMNSQETYIAAGESLGSFRPAQEGAQAVIYAPLVVNEQAFGLLWVANSRLAFEPHMVDIMTALVDYAAIAIVNGRLFAAMHRRSKQLEQMYRQLHAQQQELQQQVATTVGGPPPQAGGIDPVVLDQLRGPLTHLLGNMNLFRTGELGALSFQNQAAVDVMHRQLEELIGLIDSVMPTGH
jgi:two-component system NtrC family sensor kinase